MKRAMLAPLKDRSILLRADDESTDNEAALRLALRQARQAQRQAAEHGARQSIALTNEVARLSEHNRQMFPCCGLAHKWLSPPVHKPESLGGSKPHCKA